MHATEFLASSIAKEQELGHASIAVSATLILRQLLSVRKFDLMISSISKRLQGIITGLVIVQFIPSMLVLYINSFLSTVCLDGLQLFRK